MKSDLSFPILVTKYDKKFLVVDGVHRLYKAVLEGKEFIHGRFVKKEVMEKAKIK